MYSSKAVLALLLAAVPAFADSTPHGSIKICKFGNGLYDHKAVKIPAGTYTGACDAMGEHCRNLVITTTSSAVLAADQRCVTVSADLTQGDGKPVKVGESLVSQWSVTGLEVVAKVVAAFK